MEKSSNENRVQGSYGRSQGQLLASVLVIFGAARWNRRVAVVQVLLTATKEVPGAPRDRSVEKSGISTC